MTIFFPKGMWWIDCLRWLRAHGLPPDRGITEYSGRAYSWTQRGSEQHERGAKTIYG